MQREYEEKEVMQVRKIHDNDKYQIIRDTHSSESVNGEQLLNIVKEIQGGIDKLNTELKDIETDLPARMAKRKEEIQSSLKLLNSRMDKLKEHAEKIKPSENPITG